MNGNGLVNGNSFVNGAGKGLPGGGGLINGDGLINGCQKGPASGNTLCRNGNGGRFAAYRRKVRLAVLVVLSAALIVLVPLMAVLTVQPPESMVVDGDLSDWAGKTILSDGPDRSLPSPDLDIVRYSTTISGDDVFFLVEVAGKMMTGRDRGADVINVFIDSDLDSSTGYCIRGMGADNRVEVWGFEGASRSCSLYKFSPGKGNADWNGWSSLGSGKASAANRGVELSVWKSGLGNLASSGYRALFQIMDTRSGSMDFSKMMAGPAGGSLLIRQEPEDKPALAISPEPQPVLRLALHAKGGDMRLRELVLERSGTATDLDVGEVQLRSGAKVLSSGRFLGNSLTLRPDLPVQVGETELLNVSVTIPDTAIRGSVFGIGLAGHDSACLAKGTATVDGFGQRSFYIGAPPVQVRIDGAFGDWAQMSAHPDISGDARNPSIDIVDGRAAKSAGTISFLACVDGTMLGGECIPPPFEGRPVQVPAGSSGPSPGVMAPSVLIPRDTVTVFIDADNSNHTGFAVPGTDIGAEYSLVVTGIAGRILGREVLAWSPAGGTWVRRGTFDAARDPDRMELQASLASLGMVLGPVFKARIFATDWSGRQDMLDGSIGMTDPLQLSDNGTVYSSGDGVSWKADKTIDDSLIWRDMCTGSNGYAYALERDGTVYKSTGDWTSWSRIINSQLNRTVAIATDGTYFYVLEYDGDTYKASSGGFWSKQGDVGSGTNFEDMCIDSSGNLYAIRSDTCSTAYKSSDGGTTWSAFGDKNVGNAGGSQTNVAVVQGAGWSSTNYVFILQSDGNVRYDTDGTSIDPWNSTGAPGNSTGQDFMDLDIHKTTDELWAVALSGKVYTFNFSGSAPGGTWNTTLGNSSDSTGIWAIAVNLIPEFRDLALPLGGMIATVFILRSRRRKRPSP